MLMAGRIQWRNALPVSMFVLVFFMPFLTDLRILPGSFRWTLEILLTIIAVVVIARFIAKKATSVPMIYLVLFFIFAYIVASGIFLNKISPETFFSGLRTYFKYVPLFLLPFAYDYSKADIRKQFIVLMSFGLIQLPVVIWQRFFHYSHQYTGDNVTGTLPVSSTLSIIMVGFVLITVVLYIRKRMSLKMFIILSVLLFLPATLNETKGTMLILPLAFSGLLFILRKELSSTKLMLVTGAGLFLIIIFIFAYDSLYSREGKDGSIGILDLLSDTDQMLDKYNYTQYKPGDTIIFDANKKKVVGEYKHFPEGNELGRIDSFLLPLESLAKKDITKAIFGLGIGNIHSSVGKGGEYVHIMYFLHGAKTTLSLLIWETGILGVCIFVLILMLIAKDSRNLSRMSDTWGLFGAAWFSITLVVLISLVYNDMFHFDVISCLFFYFSGMVISKTRAIYKS